MKIDQFKQDAQELISIAATHINDSMTSTQVIQATTFYAFGVERLLKHILWSINPVFVLKNGDFKNAAPCLYKSLFINADKHGETFSKPDPEVISLRIAMQRALIFSKVVKENSQLLFSLANYRDILAHKALDEIEIEKAKMLLLRDGIKFIDGICNEFHLDINAFFGKSVSRITKISERIISQERFTEAMIARLAKHRTEWSSREHDSAFLREASGITASLIESDAEDCSYTPFKCPACNQQAVARIEPDYDYDPAEKSSYVTGIFVENVQCYFCGLRLESYQELNYVKANDILSGD